MPDAGPDPGPWGGQAGARRGPAPGRRAAASLLALALAVLAAPVLAGPPDQASLDLSARLEAMALRLDDPDARRLPAEALIAESGLVAVLPDDPPAVPAPAWMAAPASEILAAPSARRMNLRLALTMLSQSQGDEENGAVIGAQSDPDLQALVVSSGRAGLADIARAAREQGLAAEAVALTSGGTGLLLRAPLVIWPGAALDLGPGDELRLSRPDGAFLMSFGDLRIRGATVAADGPANPRIGRFVPFLAVADGGSLDVEGGRFLGLGFGDTPKFSGVSVLRSLIARPGRPSRIEGSLLEGVLTLSVAGEQGIAIRGNQFRDMRGPALAVTRTADAQILVNLFSGRLPTNAIRLDRGSQGARVEGNVILGGARAGIIVRGGSDDALIAGNLVWRRDGGGIVLAASDCGRIEGNLVIDNEQKGIELRGAPHGLVAGNRVLSNESVAIWISDQPEGSETVVRGNEVAFNAVGLAGAGGGDIRMEGNDFSGQFLRALGGELAPMLPGFARDLTGGTPMLLRASGQTQASAAAEPACASLPEGLPS